MLTFEIFSNKITEIPNHETVLILSSITSITIPFAQNKSSNKLYIVRHAEK
jgi:hypothetical protein